MNHGFARTTVLAIAAIVGLATAILMYIYFFARPGYEKAQTHVIVAAVDISANTIISGDMVRPARVPESQRLAGSATKLSEVEHMVTTFPVRAGEQILTGSLLDKGSVYGLAAVIPPGTRAMTITVDAADAVAGFLQPGYHVDIFAGFTQDSDSVARTILQNVVVLAVNTSLRPTPPGAQPKPEKKGLVPAPAPEAAATRITVAVTPSQAERLVAAQNKGKLKIGLRGIRDNSSFVTAGTSVNRMLGAAPAVPPTTVAYKQLPKRARKLPSAPTLQPVMPFIPPPQTKIRVIKGTEVQEVLVER